MRNYGNQTVLYQSFNKQLPMVCPGDGAVEETHTERALRLNSQQSFSWR